MSLLSNVPSIAQDIAEKPHLRAKLLNEVSISILLLLQNLPQHNGVLEKVLIFDDTNSKQHFNCWHHLKNEYPLDGFTKKGYELKLNRLILWPIIILID